MDEIFELAAKTEASIHLLELMYMVGMAGTMPKALELIDQARRSGLDITADSGVYDAYTVCIGTGVFDPGWQSGYLGKLSLIHISYCSQKICFLCNRENKKTL